MNILHVVPYFAPAFAYGGPPTSVSQLCRALAKRGHHLTVLTTDALTSTERQSDKHACDGLDVYYQRNLSNYLAWNHQLFLPLGTNKFLRQKLGQFDIVHLHMYRTYQNIIVRKQALRGKIPYVFSAHGTVPRIVRKKLAKAVFDEIVGRRILEDASGLTALSQAEVVQYEAMGIPTSRISTIPNGIDHEEFAALPARGTFRRRYGLDRE